MHPSEVLFQGTRQPLLLPACDHYAGSEKLMRKSMTLQQELGPLFDITFDCEDGAAAGNEESHAKLVALLLLDEANAFNRIGARVHDVNSPFFERDVEIICTEAGHKLAYIVIPKPESVGEVSRAIDLVNKHAAKSGRTTPVPVHVLIETHGALRDVHDIAALPQVECCPSASWISSRPTTAPCRAAPCARRASSPTRWWCAPSWKSPQPATRTAKCRRIT
jgi:citrate lyase subunit beta/citryl-CoA lyase